MADSTQDQLKQIKELQSLTSKVYELHEKIKTVAGDESKLFSEQIDKSKKMVSYATKIKSIGDDRVKKLNQMINDQEKSLGITQTLHDEYTSTVSKVQELHDEIKETVGVESQLYGDQIDKSEKLVDELNNIKSLTDDHINDLQRIVQEQEENLKVTQDLKEHHEKVTSAAKEQLQPLEDMKSKVKGVGDTIQGFILNPWFILGGLLLLGINYFKQIEDAAQGFRETTGLAVKDTKEIRDNAANLTAEMAKFGVTADEAFQASAAIADQFGSMDRVSKDTVGNVLTMSKALGLSADESAALLKSSMDMLGASEETATAFIAGTTQLAKQAKVAPKAVLQDIAQNTEAVAKFSKAGGENIAEAAVQARKLGTNMGTVAGMAEKLLDFESSIEGQMNAMVLTGRSINLDRARALAIEGDLAGMQREMLKQVGTESEFNQMNIIERKALADAIGVGVAELGQMVSRASDLEKVSSGAMEPFAAIMAGNKLSDVLDAAGLAGPLQEITRSFKSIAIIAGNVLMPLLVVLGTVLTGIAWTINQIADAMQNPWVKGITMVIGGLTMIIFLAKTKLAQNMWKALVHPVITSKALMGGLQTKIGGFGKLFTKQMGVAGVATGGLGSKIKTFFGGFTKQAKGASAAVESVSNKTKDVGKNMNKMKSRKGGIMESLMGKNMTPQKMLAGGAAMIMVAGAVWILAKAMQQFSTGVSWEGVLMGATSLGVLTAAIIAIGMIMSSGVGTVAIIAGAAAMAIMAGGMWVLGKAMQQFAVAANIAIPFFKMLFKGIGDLILTTGQAISNVINTISASFSGFVMDMGSLAAIAPGILLAAGAILALSGAMTTFALANVVAAGGGLLTALVGGGMLSQLQNIAEMAEPLGNVADSMGRITGGTVSPTFTPEPIGAQVAMAGIGAVSAGVVQPTEIVPTEEKTSLDDVVTVIGKFMDKFNDGVDLKLNGAKIGEFLAKEARK